MNDITVYVDGNFAMLKALTEQGVSWIDDNLESESWQWLGNRLCVDHRYINAIIEGVINDGLSIVCEQ